MKRKAEVFHTWVAKALFLSKRSRLDIILTVAFLCTRVKGSDEDDWKKLIRLIRFLRSTKNLYLTLEATHLSIVRWWADATFASHPDMKSHTGGAMTLGKGMIQCISQKQKLNTLSSTEAELVGANDVLSHLLWTKNFMEAQGYKAELRRTLQVYGVLDDEQSSVDSAAPYRKQSAYHALASPGQ